MEQYENMTEADREELNGMIERCGFATVLTELADFADAEACAGRSGCDDGKEKRYRRVERGLIELAAKLRAF